MIMLADSALSWHWSGTGPEMIIPRRGLPACGRDRKESLRVRDLTVRGSWGIDRAAGAFARARVRLHDAALSQELELDDSIPAAASRNSMCGAR